MQIQFVSDLHLEFDFEASYFNRRKSEPDFTSVNLPIAKSDIIILAGDIWYREYSLMFAAYLADEHKKPVLIVFGNHDFWCADRNDRRIINEVITDMRQAASNYRHDGLPVYFLENDEVVIEDTRILGATLWTDYKSGDGLIMHRCSLGMRSDFNGIGQCSTKYLLLKHRETVAWLQRKLKESFNGKTVVVTHHLPSENSLARQMNALGFAYYSDLESFILEYSPDVWIHGHSHAINDYLIGITRVLSNTRGYNETGKLIKAFNPAKLVEV